MNRILILVCAAMLAVIGVQWHLLERGERALVAAKAAHDADRAAWAEASVASAEQQREITSLRTRAKDGVINATRTENVVLARRAADLDAVAARVRDEAARLAARAGEASGDSEPGGGSATAAGAGLVLADLYRSADQEAISLARAYDAARIAGLACERSYDSLTAPDDHDPR